MGDRALVLFHNDERTSVSPVLYLHWGGSYVPAMLERVAEYMETRPNDPEYTVARACGLYHADTAPGNLSLGLWSLDKEESARLLNPETCEAVMAEMSQGDAGCIMVNCLTWDWIARGGYLNCRAEPMRPEYVD